MSQYCQFLHLIKCFLQLNGALSHISVRDYLVAQKGRGTVKGEELHGAGVGMAPWRQRGFSLGRSKCGWLIVILHILDIQKGTAWHSLGKPPTLSVTNFYLTSVSMVS